MTRSKTLWGWSLIATFGVLCACGGKAYDRAFASLTRTPVDPPSAELGARFCVDAARTLYRNAYVNRALGNTGIILGGLTFAVAGTLWLQEDHGDSSEANQTNLERASEVGIAVGLTSVAMGIAAHYAAAGKQDKALMRVEAAYKLVALAERLEQVESDLVECQNDLDDENGATDEASTNKRTDVTDECSPLPADNKDPCSAFEFERCRVRRELLIALGPCVGRERPTELKSVAPPPSPTAVSSVTAPTSSSTAPTSPALTASSPSAPTSSPPTAASLALTPAAPAASATVEASTPPKTNNSKPALPPGPAATK